MEHQEIGPLAKKSKRHGREICTQAARYCVHVLRSPDQRRCRASLRNAVHCSRRTRFHSPYLYASPRRTFGASPPEIHNRPAPMRTRLERFDIIEGTAGSMARGRCFINSDLQLESRFIAKGCSPRGKDLHRRRPSFYQDLRNGRTTQSHPRILLGDTVDATHA